MKYHLKLSRSVRVLLFLATALAHLPLFADIVPISAETRLSIPTAGWQHNARLASDAAGNYAVVYNSPDGQNDSFFFQRYSANGTFLGGHQYIGPSVSDLAMNSNGTAVVALTAESSAGDLDIYIQVFDSAGNPVFSGLPRLNSLTSGDQIAPSVAINDSGEIIAAWRSHQPSDPPNATTAYARQFTASGYFISPEIEVDDPYSHSTQKDTLDTAIDSAGDFLLAWTDWYHPNRDPMDVFAQRFSRGGNPNGGAFMVNTVTTDMQRYPRVAMRQDTGEFAMTWHSWSPAESSWQLRFRRFSATGVKLGSERSIDDNTTTGEPIGDIDMDSSGIAVVWGATDGDRDIYMRTFNLDGTDRSPTTLINTFTASLQHLPAVTLLPNLEMVAAWTSHTQDGDSGGIYSAHFLDQ